MQNKTQDKTNFDGRAKKPGAEKMQTGKMRAKKNSRPARPLKLTIIIFAAVVAAAYCVTAGVRLYRFKQAEPPRPLTEAEQQELDAILDGRIPGRNAILKPLPYPVVPARLDIGAEAAIIVDAASGSILYEKNADEIIPPASLTKIAVMYVVLSEIESGRISYNDIVPLPPETWAANMPPRSSLMFLGKGQIVSVEELLLGLDIASGNDAAYALAYYVSGNMETFVERMNAEMSALGLRQTHFVESSGYSEENTTTAREMAALARVYIEKFPDSLARFHSRRSFTYPQEHNLAPEDRGRPRAQDFSGGIPESITMGITQQNTNPLLGRLDGCDGLKTGFIPQSGYNLALTAHRENTRFISVTLGGPGMGTGEGNVWRVRDGTTLMEWAFSQFADCKRTDAVHRYFIPVTGAVEQWVYLAPAYDFSALSVPFIAGETPAEAAEQVRVFVNFPRYIDGGVSAGEQYGEINYVLGETTLESIPLVADRSIAKANAFVSASDFFARLILETR